MSQKNYTNETRQNLVDRYENKLFNKFPSPAKYLAASIAGYYFKDADSDKIFNTEIEKFKDNERPLDFIKRTPFSSILTECLTTKSDKEKYKLIIQKSNQFQFSMGYQRRSVRSKDYSFVIQKDLILMHDYYIFKLYNTSLSRYIKNELEEEKLDLKLHNDTYYSSYGALNNLDMMIAAELDWDLEKGGSGELHETIKDMILGENNTSIVSVPVIRGILKSDDFELHELLGKLLLAARLQEGVRQAICENMDSGTISAFNTLFALIRDNNLIRFSGVKRAVATWIGLYNENAAERISQKTLDLMNKCLYDKTEMQTMLKSDDAMELMTALWADGFYEASNAVKDLQQIFQEGKRNQLLTAAYYISSLYDERIYKKNVEYVIETYGNDLEIAAAFFHVYLNNYNSFNSFWYKEDNPDSKNFNYSKTNSLPDIWFDGNKEKAEIHVQILYNLFLQLGKNKKAKIFKHCAFPWNTVSISKEAIAMRICVLAITIPDSVSKDIVYEMIKYAGSLGCAAMNRLFKVREDKKDRDYVLHVLNNKNLIKTAAHLLEEVSLNDEDYVYIESLLHYKDPEIRSIASDFIAERSDEGFKSSINRLLHAKTEDERFAGLSFISQLKEHDEELGHKDIDYRQFKEAVSLIPDPTTKENALIKNIFGYESNENDDTFNPPAPNVEALYDESKILHVSMDGIKVDTSDIDKIASCSKQQIVSILEEFDKLVTAHKNDQYKAIGGEDHLLGEKNQYVRHGHICMINTYDSNLVPRPIDLFPFAEMWMDFYNTHIKNPVILIQLFILIHLSKHKKTVLGKLLGNSEEEYSEYNATKVEHIEKLLFGKLCQVNPGDFEYFKQCAGSYSVSLFMQIAENLIKTVCDTVFLENLILQFYYKLLKEADKEDLWHKIKKNPSHYYFSWADGKESFTLNYVQPLKFLNQAIIDCKNFYRQKNKVNEIKEPEQPAFSYSWSARNKGEAKKFENDKDFTLWFSTMYEFALKADLASRTSGPGRDKTVYGEVMNFLYAEHFFRAYKLGLINLDSLYYGIIKITTLAESLSDFTFYKSKDSEFAEIYKRINDTIIINELRRGDKESSTSCYVHSVRMVSGSNYLLRILQALGKAPFIRGLTGTSYQFTTDFSRNTCLCHLLVAAKPLETDTAKKMKDLIDKYKIPEQRLYDLAMYNTKWIPLLSEVLEVPFLESGCYYFIAHMKEDWSNHRDKSAIVKFTPLSIEELNKGAFDLNWFMEIYAELGEETFNRLYLSAKYITDGAKHSRARKFADAALGRVKEEELEVEINRARNKDLMMSYPLLPINEKGDAFRERILHRYEFIQNFKKESRRFGAQRRLSEGEAVEIALENLSRSAGYTDVNRLNLNMESALIDKNREFFEWTKIDDYETRISVDENGKPSIQCRKIDTEKILKNAPSAVKKSQNYEHINDVYKRLKQQHERTRLMFENFMTEQVVLSAGEVAELLKNPVVSPIVSNLVFISDDKECGLILNEDDKIFLMNYEKEKKLISNDKEVRVAHAYDLYAEKKWHEWQKFIFDNQIIQPFKQVFRELYLKLNEELESDKTFMFAGNQLQPKKAAAVLKSRRWVADYESGLQKVFYKQNLIAEIYAQTDWFSPADIECPALEYVRFFPRHYLNGKINYLKIKDIDEILYSEIMRDVDLAVSVAHTGGVDPETSHSTIEMRRAVCEFTLPLFKIENVRFEKNFAFIKGSRAEYSIHLGSGLIHKSAGGTINIVAVHSQQRGKLFLPFIDEDPKTAEILTKILMLARDESIKDPYILNQITSEL